MQITVDQKSLNAAIAATSKAIASRPALPILANILMVADGELLTLTGFDLSMAIVVSIDAAVLEGGSITLPSKLLGDIVSRLPDGVVEISVADNSASVSAGNASFNVSGIGADQYPDLDFGGGDAVALQIGAAEFLKGMNGALFAVSTDESKQILTGVNLGFSLKELVFAATDGHRLAIAKLEEYATGDQLQRDCTVPSKALREVAKMAAAAGSESMAIALTEGFATFEAGGNMLMTRLLDGQYPNYNQLIPKSFSRSSQCDRRRLIAALERVAVLADMKNSIVLLTFDADSVTVSVEAADVGAAKESMEHQLSGEGLAIAFNAHYLIDGLKAIGSAEVLISMNSPTSPAVLTPVDGERSKYLVMPVQQRN